MAIKHLADTRCGGPRRTLAECSIADAFAEEAINAESAPLVVHELDQRVMQPLRRRMDNMKVESATSNGGAELAR